MSTELKIAYFYPKLLNLYGDNGNVEILVARAKRRGFSVQVIHVDHSVKLDSHLMKSVNLVFMGGGPDSGQKLVYDDLKNVKGSVIQEYIENNGVGLYICGAYQLLGNYYKAADGSIIEGLEIFDLYTESFGNQKPRCIGNTVATLSTYITEDPLFKNISDLGDKIVGFENHGGRTYLKNKFEGLAKVEMGHGNNSEDKIEGILHKNSIGTYFHGPFLARNPHIADYLIAKALQLDRLSKLTDHLIRAAHTASLKLKQ